jgi:hypothetical protein
MKTLLALAGACALFAAVSASDALAQGRGKGHGNSGAMSRGLDRADVVADRHGNSGRVIARGRGANAFGFCPPGQRKKAGRGSRFMC